MFWSRQSHRGASSSVLLACLLIAWPAAQAVPLNVKLNPPFAPGIRGLNPSGTPSLSPDGRWLVYEADRDGNGFFAIYSVPVAGGPSTQLSDLVHWFNTGIFEDFRISPDSSRVLYALRKYRQVDDLVSVPIAGGTPVRLSQWTGLPAGLPAITPDSSRVVFFCGGGLGLCSAPLTGGPETLISAPFPALPGPGNFFSVRRDVLMSPDGSRVVYSDCVFLSFENFGCKRLFNVPIAGGQATLLAEITDLDFQREISLHRIAPDGSRVALLANLDDVRVDEIYSVALAGGPLTKLNAPVTEIQLGFQITPDSSRVIYRAFADRPIFELFSVPLAGGPVTRLSEPGIGVSGLGRLGVTPDGARVIFQAFGGGFRSVSVAGGPVTALAPGSLDPVSVGPLLSPDGEWVVLNLGTELDAAPVAGGQVVKLTPPLVEGGRIGLFSEGSFIAAFSVRITPDGSRVVYGADQDTDGVEELYSVPLTGGEVVQLNGPLVAGGDVKDFAITPGSRWVVYTADQDIDGVVEYYRSPVAPPRIEIAIRPDEDPNEINPRSRGLIPVAILGSSEVDVADVDAATLAFGPAGAIPAKPILLLDVDDDGFTDLTTRFRTRETGVLSGDTEACLRGLHGGLEFHACDEIVTVGQ